MAVGLRICRRIVVKYFKSKEKLFSGVIGPTSDYPTSIKSLSSEGDYNLSPWSYFRISYKQENLSPKDKKTSKSKKIGNYLSHWSYFLISYKQGNLSTEGDKKVKTEGIPWLLDPTPEFPTSKKTYVQRKKS